MAKRFILACLAVSLFLTADGFGEDCSEIRFTVNSTLATAYADIVKLNAEVFCKNLKSRYFQTGPATNLTIYLSENFRQTNQLISSNGHGNQLVNGFYVPDANTIYIHRKAEDKQFGCWKKQLFCHVTEHCIRKSFPEAPAWFKEGLSGFLGWQTWLCNDQLVITGPKPAADGPLKEKIDRGSVLNIKMLLTRTDEQFYKWPYGRHFATEFFYWLNSKGRLKDYLKRMATEPDYTMKMLEETLSASYSEINIELSEFLKKNCYAETYLYEAMHTADANEKEQLLQKALELKPDYNIALMELAECYYHMADYQKYRDSLEKILNSSVSREYQRAAGLMGDFYRKREKYSEAIEYYKKSWENSDLCENRYRTAYAIASCYVYLEDEDNAEKWYRTFLDCKWDPDVWQEQADYARQFVGKTAEPVRDYKSLSD